VPQEVDDLSNSDVVSKAREASQIAQQVLDGVLSQVAPGKRAVELCSFGDALIEGAVKNLYKTKKGMEKGIAFPTCVSVNNCVAHYSPLESEDKVVLKEGDSVKMCVRRRGAGRAQWVPSHRHA
jgi:methionine aminopeptidase